MDVAGIQRALLARGYDLGPSAADGDAGLRTIAAVTAFQRSAGLVADGIAGPKTQAALQKADISERREAPEKPGWLVLAEGELGVREGAGAANNPRVVQLFADAGFSGIKQDSVAWCAAAVGAMLKRAGHQALGQPRGAVLRGLGRRAERAGAGRHRHEEAGQLVLAGPCRLRRRGQREPDFPARRQPGRCVVRRRLPAQGVHRLPLAGRCAAAGGVQATDDNRRGALGRERGVGPSLAVRG